MTEEHMTKHYSIFEIAINLAIACFISGAIIAVTYYFTAPITRQNTENTKTEMMHLAIHPFSKRPAALSFATI